MDLGILDWLVLAVYFAAILGVGLLFGRGERSTHDFFLGGRTQHWLIVGLSILATELSAVTFVLVPADSFRTDWTYLQMYAGAILGRVLIAVLLLPAFYGRSVTTVYEYLGRRFGPWTRTTASALFVVSRLIGSGIRLLAASLAIAVVFDWPVTLVIIGTACVAVAYTTFGGIKAIIWTDALQALVFLGGGVAVVIFMLVSVPGGLTSSIEAAYDAGKFRVFTWSGNLNCEKLFWVLLISSTVQNMAAMGTDQDMTQRMLTCPDLRRGQRSLLFNTLIGLPTVCLFLVIGSLMFAYSQTVPGSFPAELGDRGDRLFPYFIANVLPAGVGLRGLLVAGVFAAAMSSLDSALGALSSTAVTDFYRPICGSRISERHALIAARCFTFFFGLLLVAIALGFSSYDELLWEVFRWAGLVLGAMLGVFLLGVLTRRRGRDGFNVIAMLTSVVLLVALKLYQEQTGLVYIAWPWWVVVGSAWTFLWGMCLSTSPRRT